MALVRVGSWAAASAFLASGPARVDAAFKTAIRREAELFRKEVVQGIANQAPAGKRFKPLSPRTLALRRFQGFKGTKALMRGGDLRRSIKVVPAPGGGFFVGVLRSARGRDGQSLVNVAAVHEFGAKVVLRLTPKMIRFLHLVFKRAGLSSPPGIGAQGAVSRVAIITIPPRPYFTPVAEKLRPGAARRVTNTVAIAMGIGAKKVLK